MNIKGIFVAVFLLGMLFFAPALLWFASDNLAHRLLAESNVEAWKEFQKKSVSEKQQLIGPLSTALSESKSQVRFKAIWILSQIPQAVWKKPDAFQKGLKDPYWRVRWQSVIAIGDSKYKPLIPSLFPLIQDVHPKVRHKVSWTLGQLGPEFPFPKIPIGNQFSREEDAFQAWKPYLKSKDPVKRSWAALEISKLSSVPFEEELRALLQDPDWRVRWRATIGVGKKRNVQDLNVFGKLLSDKNFLVRREAARAVRWLFGCSPEVSKRFCELLKDPNFSVRREAARGFRWLRFYLSEEEKKQAVKALTEVVNDPDKHVRREASWTLGELGNFAEGAIPELKVLLQDSYEYASENAATALQQIGIEDKEFIEAVVEAFWVRQEKSLPATMRKNKEGTVAFLINALANPKMEVQKDAIRSLRLLGPLAGGAVSSLLPFLNESESLLRYETVWALGAIGEDSTVALELLEKALDDSDEYVSECAAWAIGKTNAEEAIPLLKKTLEHRNGSTRYFAARALLARGIKEDKVLEQIKEALKESKREYLRKEVVLILQKESLKEIARLLLPTLEEVLSDEDEEVRFQVGRLVHELTGKCNGFPVIFCHPCGFEHP